MICRYSGIVSQFFPLGPGLLRVMQLASERILHGRCTHVCTPLHITSLLCVLRVFWRTCFEQFARDARRAAREHVAYRGDVPNHGTLRACRRRVCRRGQTHTTRSGNRTKAWAADALHPNMQAPQDPIVSRFRVMSNTPLIISAGRRFRRGTAWRLHSGIFDSMVAGRS